MPKSVHNFLPKNQKGITLFELTIVVGVMLFLFTGFLIVLRPEERRREARDNKRLSDMATLDRAINEFLLDNGAYPDATSTVRTSDVLPSGGY